MLPENEELPRPTVSGAHLRSSLQQSLSSIFPNHAPSPIGTFCMFRTSSIGSTLCLKVHRSPNFRTVPWEAVSCCLVCGFAPLRHRVKSVQSPSRTSHDPTHQYVFNSHVQLGFVLQPSSQESGHSEQLPNVSLDWSTFTMTVFSECPRT